MEYLCKEWVQKKDANQFISKNTGGGIGEGTKVLTKVGKDHETGMP